MSLTSHPLTKRTRFVCVSDTHNTYPKLPAGDVLIHAGDLTNTGSISELQRTVKWIESADFEAKIVVAGNHDTTLDHKFYTQHGSYFHHKDVQDPVRCLAALTDSPTITYLNHEAKVVRLTKPSGAQTCFKVFGSPYSPSRGFWAFGYAAEDAAALWDQIPLDTDVLVTHTPPRFHRDESGTRGSAGCEDLRQALWRVRPRLAVCGHIHEARGAEIARWDIESLNIRYKELGSRQIADTTGDSRKQFRVDLSARSLDCLKNDGGRGEFAPFSRLDHLQGVEAGMGGDATADEMDNLLKLPVPVSPFPGHEATERPIPPFPDHEPRFAAASRGQGGSASSGRSDREALSGREGRLETCVVNAAILGSSWPHKAGKRFQKPIVVDLDLPVALDADA